MVTSVNVFCIHPLRSPLSQLQCIATSESLTCRLTSRWTVLKGAETPSWVFFLPAWPNSGLGLYLLLTQWRHASESTHLQFTFQQNYRNMPPSRIVYWKKLLNLPEHFFPPQLEKPLQHKSILSDWLKRIWPLRSLADHQKIVFTTTLSATLTLTNAMRSMVVWVKCV